MKKVCTNLMFLFINGLLTMVRFLGKMANEMTEKKTPFEQWKEKKDMLRRVAQKMSPDMDFTEYTYDDLHSYINSVITLNSQSERGEEGLGYSQESLDCCPVQTQPALITSGAWGEE